MNEITFEIGDLVETQDNLGMRYTMASGSQIEMNIPKGIIGKVVSTENTPVGAVVLVECETLHTKLTIPLYPNDLLKKC